MPSARSSGSQPRHDQVPPEPARTNPITRLQTQTGGYIARRPGLLRALEWLGWNNPGGSMNP